MKIIQEISEMDLRNHFLVAVAEVYLEERYLVSGMNRIYIHILHSTSTSSTHTKYTVVYTQLRLIYYLFVATF